MAYRENVNPSNIDNLKFRLPNKAMEKAALFWIQN